MHAFSARLTAQAMPCERKVVVSLMVGVALGGLAAASTTSRQREHKRGRKKHLRSAPKRGARPPIERRFLAASCRAISSRDWPLWRSLLTPSASCRCPARGLDCHRCLATPSTSERSAFGGHPLPSPRRPTSPFSGALRPRVALRTAWTKSVSPAMFAATCSMSFTTGTAFAHPSG